MYALETPLNYQAFRVSLVASRADSPQLLHTICTRRIDGDKGPWSYDGARTADVLDKMNDPKM